MAKNNPRTVRHRVRDSIDCGKPNGFDKKSFCVGASEEYIDVLKIEAMQDRARAMSKPKPVTLPKFSWDKR